MKKLFFLSLLGLAYESWHSIDDFVSEPPDYSTVENEVILYATEWCGYCQKARELFKDNNISYVEYDIDKSKRGHAEYKRLGGNGIPLLKINGKVINGYRPKMILASLNAN